MPNVARHGRRLLALAACLTLVGTTADAAPSKATRTVKKARKVKLQHEEVIATDEIALEDATDDDEEPTSKKRREVRSHRRSARR
jgi:predicted metal-dependent TIM-barrel fold hydrolase